MGTYAYVFIALVTICVCVLLILTNSDTGLSSVYKQCVPSIVTICSIWDDQNTIHGSGFVVSKGGYILTAGHLVRRRTETGSCVASSKVYVTFPSTGKVFLARIVCIDGRADVAVLSIDATDLTPLSIGGTVESGDTVVIIGNTFGIDGYSMSTGVVRNPRWKDPNVHSLLTNILTTVPTANGVSGAPIIDIYGHVVGIHTSAMHPKLGGSDSESVDAQFSTSFGGGLAGHILKQIVERCISDDKWNNVYVLKNYSLTKKCLPQFDVVANRIENRLRFCTTAVPNIDRGYIIVSIHENATDLMVGDILSSINGRSVGLKQADDAFGDCSWFLNEGDRIELIVHRFCLCSNSYETLCLQHTVKYLPTALDIATNDPQFMFITALLVTGAVLMSTMAVVGGISDTMNENKRTTHDYCTNITIIKPAKYGPSTVLEDPEYDHRIHDRCSFNATDYYLRRLSLSEQVVQSRRNVIYEIMQDIQLSCIYNGKTEYITCPAGRVFDGDSLKRMLNIENDGIGWVFHDWLYFSHAFDMSENGTQTSIPHENRWIADELMYEIVRLDGYSSYAGFTKRFDLFVGPMLDTSWNFITENQTHSNVYISPP
jgi:hypothetical protein